MGFSKLLWWKNKQKRDIEKLGNVKCGLSELLREEIAKLDLELEPDDLSHLTDEQRDAIRKLYLNDYSIAQLEEIYSEIDTYDDLIIAALKIETDLYSSGDRLNQLIALRKLALEANL